MTAYFKEKGSTLFEALLSLYKEHGFYKEALVSVKKEGKKGQEEISAIMKAFRENPPKEIAGEKLIQVKDYLKSVETNLVLDATKNIELPKSDVIQLFTEEGSKISMRPSGTEPKIKFYVGVKGRLEDESEYEKEEARLSTKINELIDSLGL